MLNGVHFAKDYKNILLDDKNILFTLKNYSYF